MRRYQSPILLIGFNRPHETKEVLLTIKKVEPSRLYFAVDGPRRDNVLDERRCQEVRALINLIDWPCKIFKYFRQENRGCKHGVSEAITWFFNSEEQGIILEDDVIPSMSFFYYCDELLEKYAEDRSIGLVCGVNFIEGKIKCEHSYLFSKYSHIWGWATWRRAWDLYDVRMNDWPALRNSKEFVNEIATTSAGRNYWINIFDRSYEGAIDTWDYQLIYSSIKNKMLSIIPSKNLILNIGFGPGATHTLGDAPKHVVCMRASEIDFPLSHPTAISNDQNFDYLLNDEVFHAAKGLRLLIRRVAKFLHEKLR